MKFQPKTDEEIMQSGVLDGVFDFEIKKAREYTSEKGNETFEIDLNVFDSDGNPRPRKDWLTPAFAKKFKHVHDSCGMLDKYLAGSTTEDDFVGKTGKLKMGIRKYINREGKEAVGDQIEDYIKRDNATAYSKATTVDDEIPF